MTSSADILGIALPSSDRDHPDYCAPDLDNALVFLPDSSKHFPAEELISVLQIQHSALGSRTRQLEWKARS
jgi:hypothetical protein